MRSVGLGRDNLRSHFVFRPRHAPEWLRARFLPVVFLANEEELNGKTFTTSLNTTNRRLPALGPNTYVKFIFLRTSPLIRPMRLEDQELIISMLSSMKNDGTFVMPTWRLCIALFYPWTGRRFLTWRRTLMDCGKWKSAFFRCMEQTISKRKPRTITQQPTDQPLV